MGMGFSLLLWLAVVQWAQPSCSGYFVNVQRGPRPMAVQLDPIHSSGLQGHCGSRSCHIELATV